MAPGERLTLDHQGDELTAALRRSPDFDALGLSAVQTVPLDPALVHDVMPADSQLDLEVVRVEGNVAGRELRASAWHVARTMRVVTPGHGSALHVPVQVRCDWPAGVVVLARIDNRVWLPAAAADLEYSRSIKLPGVFYRAEEREVTLLGEAAAELAAMVEPEEQIVLRRGEVVLSTWSKQVRAPDWRARILRAVALARRIDEIVAASQGR